jgi:hypothetical protein
MVRPPELLHGARIVGYKPFIVVSALLDRKSSKKPVRIPCPMKSIEKYYLPRLRQARRSIQKFVLGTELLSLTSPIRKPVCPSLITSRQRPSFSAMTGTSAALASTRTSPNHSGMTLRLLEPGGIAVLCDDDDLTRAQRCQVFLVNVWLLPQNFMVHLNQSF